MSHLSQSATEPDIAISPLPKREVELIVFRFVPETNAACFALKVAQSAALSAHLFAAEAVGTFNVITGVVVPVATDEDKFVPVVHKVRAETFVTVPVHLEFS